MNLKLIGIAVVSLFLSSAWAGPESKCQDQVAEKVVAAAYLAACESCYVDASTVYEYEGAFLHLRFNTLADSFLVELDAGGSAQYRVILGRSHGCKIFDLTLLKTE